MKVLIVEDDKILSNTIKECIEDKYDIEQVFSGDDGFLYAKQNIYDVIILDIMLPKMNGYEILRKLRKEKVYTPVLILTAKNQLEDELKGFEFGADDFLTKPFETSKLLVRLDAMIRRNNSSYIQNILEFKELKLYTKEKKATIKGQNIKLRPKQFDMLEYLLMYKNTIIPKENIFDKIWGFNSETTTNVVEVYAVGLRKELKKYGYDKFFKTIRGVGYMLSE